jgi:hypothetical protein
MQSFVGIVALSQIGASVADIESTQSCNVDLTKNGLLNCQQVCQDWCWATVIGDYKEYYKRQEGSNDTPLCAKHECRIVSNAIGDDCCAPLDPSRPGVQCGGASAVGTCGGPASIDTVLSQLRAEIPSQNWVQTGAPSEAQLQKLLLSGHPVGRTGFGHIDTVAGCRPCQGGQGGCPKGSGGHEYRLIDSLFTEEVWYSYEVMVNPNPQASWTIALYSSGYLGANVSGTVFSDPPVSAGKFLAPISV